MTVMQLEGESAQLRQVARMHANGDITLDDYRNIRTVMIDAFLADLGDSPIVADVTDPAATLVGVEVTVPERQFAYAGGRVAAADEHAAAESTMALLAILGAGAMLLIVAMLAVGLGT